MRHQRWTLPGVVLTLFALSASAVAQSTYRITELFSNQDGSIQFIRLSESAGMDEQGAFQDLAITVTYRGGSRRWVFPVNLPFASQTAHRDVVIGIAPKIPVPTLGDVATIFQYTDCCIVIARPDYVLPPNFLPTDGATVDFAGIDAITYNALPTDGANALYRDQSVSIAALPAAGCPGSTPLPAPCPQQVHPSPTLVTAVEYYNATLNHYFVTASAPDLDALDSGRIVGWQRTGDSFAVGTRAATNLGLEYTFYGDPACRFYIPPAHGDSHFFSASADECAAVAARFPEFVLETSAAFYAALPDRVTGQCGVMPGWLDGDIALSPVFRLWNGRADTNHRYTTRPEVRDAMIAQGWISEGYGPLGVAFCF